GIDIEQSELRITVLLGQCGRALDAVVPLRVAIPEDQFGNGVLQFVRSVEAVRLQSLSFAEAVIKKSGPSTNHHLRRFGRVCARAWRPGESDSWCEVELTADIGLIFVAQAVAES